jgi:hypothetical protein
LVGKMVYTLFESIMGNKGLEERLLKAGSKRHRKPPFSSSWSRQLCRRSLNTLNVVLSSSHTIRSKRPAIQPALLRYLVSLPSRFHIPV